jgi:hypothetical protein
MPLECRCTADHWAVRPGAPYLSCSASIAEAALDMCTFFGYPISGYPSPPSGIAAISGCGRVAVDLNTGYTGSGAVFDESTGKLVGMYDMSDDGRFGPCDRNVYYYGDAHFFDTRLPLCDNTAPTCFPCADGSSWTTCASAASE